MAGGYVGAWSLGAMLGGIPAGGEGSELSDPRILNQKGENSKWQTED